MHPVTRVSFDRRERQMFERSTVWANLGGPYEHGPVLLRLAMNAPDGVSRKFLLDAQGVLTAIQAMAKGDLEQWRPSAANAPETAPQGSLIARPRQAAQMIVEAREQALRDVTRALELIEAALLLTTAPQDEVIRP